MHLRGPVQYLAQCTTEDVHKYLVAALLKNKHTLDALLLVEGQNQQ